MGSDNKRQATQSREQGELKIGHERFQFFRFLQQQDLLEITQEVQSEKDIRGWQQSLEKTKRFEDVESLLLPTRYDYQPRGFCGSVGSVKICYENFPYLFSEEIENRMRMQKHFEETELWYLLHCLVTSAKDFAKLDMKVGDVRPGNIFINEDGQIKVANVFSWPDERTNFEKTAFEKMPTYLSPEEADLVAEGKHDNVTNKVLSESFSIGVTLLEAGLLWDVGQLYNPRLDRQNLARKLDEWMQLQYVGQESGQPETYSDLLKGMVAALCHPQTEQRESCLQIEQLLRPHQSQISHLKPFDQRGIKFRMPGQFRPQELHPQAQQIVTQQVLIPQQVYQIGRPIEPKGYIPEQRVGQYPPPESARVVANGQPLVRFANQTDSRYFTAQQPRGVNFSEYYPNGRVGQPELVPINRVLQQPQIQPFQPVQILDNPTDQQFQRYANPGQRRPLPQVQISDSKFQGQFNRYTTPNPPPVANNYSYVPPSTKYNFTLPSNTTNYAPTATSQYSSDFGLRNLTPATGEASDFLRKIDEQLQQSRRQFPSG